MNSKESWRQAQLCRPLSRVLLAAAPALALALLSVAVPSRAGGDHDWVGVEKCRTCHEKELMGNQVATWKAGPHRRAFETLRSPESVAIAERQQLAEPAHESDACLRCHLSAHGVPPVRIAHPLSPEDGVQCESCHGPGRDYRKKKIMSDRKKAERKGLRDASDPAVCSGCHNEESPTFDPERYDLPSGGSSGFHLETALSRMAHEIPEDVKGHFIELEKAEKAEKKKREKAAKR